MLTFEDCLELCNLCESEIMEIASHEHIPMITALELGEYLVRSKDGEYRIKRMIIEDMEEARRKGDEARLQNLEGVLKNFVAAHPRAKQLETP